MSQNQTGHHGGRPGGPDQATIDRINSQTNYSMWAVFAGGSVAESDVEDSVGGIDEAIAASGAQVRAFYDLTGYRADADLMVWFTADNPESLQEAYRALSLSALPLEPVWSIIGLHRQPEFNKDHVPGYLLHENAPKYAAIYPFVRSYDWYLLKPFKRAAIMKDHGMAGRDYGELVTSTLATFALSDYEWVVSIEGDDLKRIVDLMYTFRNTEARLYVREDTPFFTGVKTELIDWARRQAYPNA